MFRTIGTYIYAAMVVISTLFELHKTKKLVAMNQATDEQLFIQPKRVSRKVVEFTGTKVHVEGQENLPDGPVLFVANHQGLFDILALLGYLGKPIGFIAKKEIKKLPIISSWMELIYCVFIDRTDRRQSVKAIHQGTEYLKAGHSMVIFPEGTRGEGREINEFKAGSFRLGTKAKVPIVPLAIDGTFPMLEEDNGRIKSSAISLKILDPIIPEEYQNLKSKELAEKVQSMVEANLPEELVQNNHSKKIAHELNT